MHSMQDCFRRSRSPPRASIAARLWLWLIARHIDDAGAAGDRHLRLASIELRAAPLHAGIRRAFEEMDAVHAREALELVEREDQRLVDQAVDDEPIVFGIDLGDPAMMALETQTVRRDDARRVRAAA